MTLISVIFLSELESIYKDHSDETETAKGIYIFMWDHK